ncbi:alanine:cation symporter family protein [Flammeovirga yaeyamensis]|uniref:Alanine:cation symporter family protein n=1 Tax=Flammeovirga yaeyamensis TaxID=367791 RepID=A0AAX1N885_9BACT|nr:MULTISPECIES: alanine/glycine:cation symporter family protein [Flammeovirga]ANQ50458.1 alanine:cation symporter family protein [Flammeovirga sp. MY04]MBB3699584.1 AGCS family alanine or glycine:cation symporter [Flammeovirga yaeyamensis]NMF36843.1 alanine:cation symporter family protein [Flammeovirga yaeyamensis]QWG02118.1 alanine:cation symporter family protein [Flammeovirga yaeyamensis]
MDLFQRFCAGFSALAWGTPLLVLLLGGGLFFTIYSRFLPFRYFKHAIDVLRGKYDDPDAEGDIDHYEALSGAIAATVGMGNISGVAVALVAGGPGALFWMWISALLGMATKFFTCTLSVMYRGHDSHGHAEGGPMYFIEEGLGKKWKPLAVFFALAGLFGVTPMFQANQLTEVLRTVVFVEVIPAEANIHLVNFIIGMVILVLVSIVIFGGIERIGTVAGKLVPVMVVIYVVAVLTMIVMNVEKLPGIIDDIFEGAFNFRSVGGGALGAVIMIGAKRAAFSNEAGIGTAPMMHGAAKTDEPVREGLVAMIGPFIDTIVVCTMTALAIMSSGVYDQTAKKVDGVLLTTEAFKAAFPVGGAGVLSVCVLFFALTTLFSFSYYGTKCLGYLIGADKKHYFNYFYVCMIVVGAMIKLEAIINLIDGVYATMAIPTMVGALLLSPKVRQASIDYFERMDKIDYKRRY